MGNTSGMEENKMQNITIGKSGIEVPFLGMGTWAIGGGSWWGDNDDALSVNAIEAAVEQGIRWIDTAPIYGLYHSEQVVGEALRHIDRDKVVLSTKCGLEWRHETPVLHKVVDGTAVYRDLSAQSIIEDVEESLKRLGTDYVDILYTHWQCMTYGKVPVAETMGTLMDMKKEGKIRAIGASNVTPGITEEYIAAGQLDVVQEKLSILDRKPEKELLPLCEKHGITLQTYSPIEQGLLSGKISNDYRTRPGEVRHGRIWWEPEDIAAVNAMLAGWSDLTGKYHCTLANLCVRWNSLLSERINVLCGARKLAQIEDNVRSMEVPLSREDFLRMKADADKAIREREARHC